MLILSLVVAQKRLGRPRGIILWLVLGLGVVMAILAFSFYSIVRDQNVKAHVIYFSQAALSLAESGANHAIDAVRKALQDPASETSRAIMQAPEAGLETLPMPSGWQMDLQQFVLGTQTVSVTVDVAVADVRSLGSPSDLSQGFDSGERLATLVVTSTGQFRGVRQTVVERRPLKVVRLALPVVSRFSLFVRSPDATDETAIGYNTYANSIGGSPDPSVSESANVLPLVVYNHEGGLGASSDAASHGWVFLGGDRELVLNLTSGGDYRFGQYFHFYDFLALDTSRPAAFINDSPPPFFEQPHAYAYQQQRFAIKHAFYGYFTIDEDPTDPADMNRDGILRMYFDSRINMRSSTLHLFGSSLQPSPTMVLGNVYHSYPIYSAVTVDVDGDGTRDGIVKMLPAVAEEDYPDLETTDPLPTQVPFVGDPSRSIYLDSLLMHYSRMFGGYADYAPYTSLLVEREAYNTGVDYLRSSGEFPPQRSAFDPAQDYPNPGTQVTIPAANGGTPHFAGDLNAVDGRSFGARVVLRVRDEAEFKQLFLDGAGQLSLGAVVSLDSGDLTLPERTSVVSGGVVLCPGTIRFDQIAASSGQVLTLCSTEKNLVGGFGGPVKASLVALKGRLSSSARSHQVDLKGGLAVDRLLAEELPAGGTLAYDERLNPSSPSAGNLYRVFLADRAPDWQM